MHLMCSSLLVNDVVLVIIYFGCFWIENVELPNEERMEMEMMLYIFEL